MKSLPFLLQLDVFSLRFLCWAIKYIKKKKKVYQGNYFLKETFDNKKIAAGINLQMMIQCNRLYELLWLEI